MKITKSFVRALTNIAAGLAATLMLVAPAAGADAIRIGGTGSALGTMKALTEQARSRMPEASFEVLSSLGSSGGLKAVARGSIQIALIARPLSAEEAADGLVALEYAVTPFVLASAKQHVASLSLQQIADIYSGKQSRWQDGTPIRVILRPRTDADTKSLAAFSPAVGEGVAKSLLREGMIVANTDQDMATELERLPGAIGTTTLGLIRAEKRQLMAIPIEGVVPTAQAVAEGRYKHVRSSYMVTKGAPAAEVARFMEFVQSPHGKRILIELGHVVPGEPRAAR